jgi:hypothetical protein
MTLSNSIVTLDWHKESIKSTLPKMLKLESTRTRLHDNGSRRHLISALRLTSLACLPFFFAT